MKVNRVQSCLVINIFYYIFFCVVQMKESNSGLEYQVWNIIKQRLNNTKRNASLWLQSIRLTPHLLTVNCFFNHTRTVVAGARGRKSFFTSDRVLLRLSWGWFLPVSIYITVLLAVRGAGHLLSSQGQSTSYGQMTVPHLSSSSYPSSSLFIKPVLQMSPSHIWPSLLQPPPPPQG